MSPLLQVVTTLRTEELGLYFSLVVQHLSWMLSTYVSQLLNTFPQLWNHLIYRCWILAVKVVLSCVESKTAKLWVCELLILTRNHPAMSVYFEAVCIYMHCNPFFFFYLFYSSKLPQYLQPVILSECCLQQFSSVNEIRGPIMNFLTKTVAVHFPYKCCLQCAMWKYHLLIY